MQVNPHRAGPRLTDHGAASVGADQPAVGQRTGYGRADVGLRFGGGRGRGRTAGGLRRAGGMSHPGRARPAEHVHQGYPAGPAAAWQIRVRRRGWGRLAKGEGVRGGGPHRRAEGCLGAGQFVVVAVYVQVIGEDPDMQQAGAVDGETRLQPHRQQDERNIRFQPSEKIIRLDPEQSGPDPIAGRSPLRHGIRPGLRRLGGLHLAAQLGHLAAQGGHVGPSGGQRADRRGRLGWRRGL